MALADAWDVMTSERPYTAGPATPAARDRRMPRLLREPVLAPGRRGAHRDPRRRRVIGSGGRRLAMAGVAVGLVAVGGLLALSVSLVTTDAKDQRRLTVVVGPGGSTAPAPAPGPGPPATSARGAAPGGRGRTVAVASGGADHAPGGAGPVQTVPAVLRRARPRASPPLRRLAGAGPAPRRGRRPPCGSPSSGCRSPCPSPPSRPRPPRPRRSRRPRPPPRSPSLRRRTPAGRRPTPRPPGIRVTTPPPPSEGAEPGGSGSPGAESRPRAVGGLPTRPVPPGPVPPGPVPPGPVPPATRARRIPAHRLPAARTRPLEPVDGPRAHPRAPPGGVNLPPTPWTEGQGTWGRRGRDSGCERGGVHCRPGQLRSPGRAAGIEESPPSLRSPPSRRRSSAAATSAAMTGLPGSASGCHCTPTSHASSSPSSASATPSPSCQPVTRRPSPRSPTAWW